MTTGSTTGKTKILTSEDNSKILWIGITGSNAGELIGEAMLAIEMGANICGCGGDAEFKSGTSTYKFTSVNGFNLIVDFKL